MFGRKKKKNSGTKKGFENIKILKPKKKRRSKKFILLYIAAFAFLIYASYTIISTSVEIKSQNEKLENIKHQIEIVEIKNENLNTVKNYKGEELREYMENIAREDLDYVKNGERVFINISGD